MYIKRMEESEAAEIVSWQYQPPYDFYNLEEDGLDELLAGSYYSVTDGNGSLIGFFCTGNSAQVPAGHKAGVYDLAGSIDIGLGMKPEMTGGGHGQSFMAHILAFLSKTYKPDNFRLSVADFNKRAITLYEKMGFRQTGVFKNGNTRFLVMEKR